LLALGFRSHTDIPALKELEEWFDTQKEIRAIAKTGSIFMCKGKVSLLPVVLTEIASEAFTTGDLYQ
jgi:hypothetical protein